MELMDSIFGFEEYSEPESPVYQALFVSEKHAIKALDELDGPIPLREAGRCLRKAMQDCSLELFRQVLEHSAPGEAVDAAPQEGVYGCGSMLLLAAMLDRPEQAALLLEKGYDCNGAGLNLTDTMQREGRSGGEGMLPYSRYSGSIGAHINVVHIGISCATPLSAALLCGSLDTAEVLLRCKGIWKAESTAVCRAAVLALDDIMQGRLPQERQANQKEILRRIFTPERACLPDRESFLHSVYLQPSCFVDFCRTDTLRCQLESGLCTERDAKEMLEVLGSNMWRIGSGEDRKRAGKLLLIKQYFPRICREDWVKGIFLRECARRVREGLPYQTILTAWKQISGKERDLTWIGGDLWTFGWKKLHRFLSAAGENAALVMDADSIKWHGASGRCMTEVLKQVKLLQRDGEGVSGMMQHLLAMGDLRALQQAAKIGLLEREDPRALLECLGELNPYNQDLRTAALTFARNRLPQDERKADWRNPHRWDYWCLWELTDDGEAEKLLHALLYGALSREECLRTMFRLHQYLDRGVFAPDMNLYHPDYPALQADSLVGFACCAESGQMLKLLQEYFPKMVQRTVGAKWEERFCFRGTPLTLAAAMGRTEQVRMLLDSGISPDEEGRGDASRFFVYGSHFVKDGFSVTPVLAAILFGQEETAKLLLERGAHCDFGRIAHRAVLLKGSAESLQLAERLAGVGFEQIPPDELEAMRLMTLPQGERTLFWNSLRQKSGGTAYGML